MTIKGKDLVRIGWESGPVFKLALSAAERARKAGAGELALLEKLEQLWNVPADHLEDEYFGDTAAALIEERQLAESAPAPLMSPVPYEVWGGEAIDKEALDQMSAACRLPIAVAGAQMPDGHVGYGLPIGGVLATRDAVIPYGVGVDIACRMKLTVTAMDFGRFEGWRDRLRKALKDETRFGIGADFSKTGLREHDVMDDPLWESVAPNIRHLKDKAWRQLGSSGSGNHFVEWGELVLEEEDLGLKPGRYIALLSHSGSRGFGAEIARHYTNIAIGKTKLEGVYKRLAWLDLKSDAGEEYWNAMNLAGLYAQANHDLIHKHVLKAASLKPILQLDNHHNFAWIEEHNGEQVVVHRKGATPAGKGVLGIIPGSMADPGYVVRGKGNARSLNSAAHGAGRVMSRKKAKETLTRSEVKKLLKDRGVELISGGLDESPQVYKQIDEVMAAQSDLVEPVAKFNPKLVMMSPDGKAED